MLVLTRYEGQSVKLIDTSDENAQPIEIKVLYVRDGTHGELVGLGFSADKKFNILRNEIIKRADKRKDEEDEQ